MKYTYTLLALLLGFGLIAFGCDTVADDDSSEPDDDDFGDDDDTVQPAYEGEIDMNMALLYGECTPTVESVKGGDTPEGWFEFEIELEGWAMDCYINFWDDVSDYCEAYDPITGDPCEPYGYTRGGWQMTNDSYGYDPGYGFWDYWVATIDYIMDLGQADATGESIFICENAGNNFTTEFCCQDDYTEAVYCTEYLW